MGENLPMSPLSLRLFTQFMLVPFVLFAICVNVILCMNVKYDCPECMCYMLKKLGMRCNKMK